MSAIMFGGIQRRYREKAKKADARLAKGNASQTTIITNNWLGHRDLFTRFGLRFDPTFALSGGSDAKFDDDATKLSVSKYWAPRALVYEEIPPSRISFVYQFRRARDQSIVSFNRKGAKGRSLRIVMACPVIIARAVGAIILALSVPVSGGTSALALARSTGWIAGRVSAFLGAKSELYGTTTGD